MKPHQSARRAITLAMVAWPALFLAQRISYREAFARATTDTSTPSGHRYETNDFTPYYQEHSAPELHNCFARVPSPDTASFTFVVALHADGTPQDFWLDRNTNIAACLRIAVLRETFPRPPFPGFYEAVHMNFGE